MPPTSNLSSPGAASDLALTTPAPAEAPARLSAPLRFIYPRLILGLDAKLLVWTCVVGTLAALLAVVYFYALTFIMWMMSGLDHRFPTYLVMPAAGVLIGLTYLLGKPGETDAVVDNIHMKNGRMDTRANIPLVPCSLLSIAAGGSAGPEAPMVYLTGSVGTWLHKFLKLPEQQVRTLTLTGMGIGFATLFGAPVGSALFALEIPHKRGMEYYEATVPSLVGGLLGYGIFAALTRHGLGSAWHFPAYHFHASKDLVLAALVGVTCGICTFPYVGAIHFFKRVFDAIKVPMWAKAALGGLILGLIAWKLPATRFWGEEQLQTALLDAAPALGMLLILAMAKMVTVAVTLAGGWRGGIIIPCFFIGACLGRAMAAFIPGLDPTLGMLCGMTAVNVSVMKVPLATILVVTTMAGVSAIAPVAVASFAAFLVTGGVNFIESKRDREQVSLVASEVSAVEGAV